MRGLATVAALVVLAGFGLSAGDAGDLVAEAQLNGKSHREVRVSGFPVRVEAHYFGHRSAEVPTFLIEVLGRPEVTS